MYNHAYFNITKLNSNLYNMKALWRKIMKIEYESKIKVHKSSLYMNLNHEMIKENKNKDVRQDKKEKGMIKNQINKKMKLKIDLLNLEQRDIQEKISIIQSEELKIEEMEHKLNQVKNIYTHTISSSENEKIKEQIKIRRLSSEVNNLKPKENQGEDTTKWKLVEDESNIVNLIDLTLRKIDKIKLEIERYKSKLISIEQSLKNSNLNLESQEEHITEEIIINPIDFVFIKGNISIGITIDIYI